ncbi:hypothetical protein H5P33_05590 [Mycolicibacterium arabiense]|uniref:hypothetical protein n=1 Tax=Mycolicibacterium arabiense TaxID=1286181 RepID=UPI0021F31E3E|nr:hypothetical protein [Mycolicibacterium arabiense]MCV7372183.1 hypothetical protein [Mycolicibacterium arabiense]
MIEHVQLHPLQAIESTHVDHSNSCGWTQHYAFDTFTAATCGDAATLSDHRLAQ